MDFYRKNCEQILNKYEKVLEDSRYIIDNEISLADFAILPFVRQFANVDINWFNRNYLYLSMWLKKIMDFDIFNQIMKKYEVWDENERGELIIFDK